MEGMRAAEYCHVTNIAYEIDADQTGRTNVVVTLCIADHASPLQGKPFTVQWPHPAHHHTEFLIEAGSYTAAWDKAWDVGQRCQVRDSISVRVSAFQV